MMQPVFDWLDHHYLFWPLFIIGARIIDVSIGTTRTIFVVRGHRVIASVLGFCEVITWLLAVSGVLVQITFIKVIAYGLGFALGNACGIYIESKIAIGQQMILMISRHRSHAVAFALRLANYIVTQIPAKGGTGDVAMCFVLVSRRQTPKVMNIARQVDEDVFLIVEDVRDSSVSRKRLLAPPTGWRAILKKK